MKEEIPDHLVKAEKFIAEGCYKQYLGDAFRLELISARHSQYIIRWRSDPANNSLFFNRKPITAEEHAAFLGQYPKLRRVDFILIENGTDLPIGTFSLTKIGGEVEIGKMIGEVEYRGRGLAKAATSALIAFAFNHLGLARLLAYTLPNNSSNISLNLSLGFLRKGEKSVNGNRYLIMTLDKSV